VQANAEGQYLCIESRETSLSFNLNTSSLSKVFETKGVFILGIFQCVAVVPTEFFSTKDNYISYTSQLG
jgi:hypothetical protein